MTHLKKYWWAYALGIIVISIFWMNWNKWFGGNGSMGIGRMAGSLKLSNIPSDKLSQLSEDEKRIVSDLFSKTNQSKSSRYVDSANAALSKIGSNISFVKNDATAKAKCKEGYDCWSLNLVIFTMCRCRTYTV